MSFSRLCVAVAYSLEADAENRKKGLKSRAVFAGGSTNSYDSKGTVVLTSQGKEECINRQLSIQVATLKRCYPGQESLQM